MGRWTARYVTGLLGMLAGAGTLAQVAPSPSPSPSRSGSGDVVVVGELPRVEPGLWQFHRYPARIVSESPAGRRLGTSPGANWQMCIPDEAVQAAVRRLLGGADDRMLQPGCSRLRVRMENGRVSGRQYCTLLGGSETKTQYEGRLQPTTLDVSMTTNAEHDGGSSQSQGRLSARRIGDCPAAPR